MNPTDSRKSPRRRTAETILLILGGLLCAVLVLPIFRWLALSALLGPAGCRMKVWVKIVDQHGNRVPGYNLKIGGWGSRIFPIGDPPEVFAWLKSDAKGMLFYDSSKRVTRIFFGNFLAEVENGKNRQYLPSMENVTLSCEDLAGGGEQSKEPKWGGLGLDTEHPLVVTVHKRGPVQRLLRCEIGDFNPRADKYVSLDILQGKKWLSDHAEGDIAFRYVGAEEYERLTHERLTSVWGEEVVASQGCGIQAVGDRYRVEPPSFGYSQRLLFPRDSKRVTTIVTGTGVIYFFLKDRACYGVLAASPNKFRSVLCLVNLDGQRNLYYEGYPSTDDAVMENFITPPVKLEGTRKAGKAGSGL